MRTVFIQFPYFVFCFFWACQLPVFATIWKVGATRTYTLPSQVASLVNHGDTIEIDAGLYESNVAVWTRHNLVFKGKGGMAVLNSNGNSAESKAIWVIKGNNNTVENIEFTGCAVPDQNGAGIRLEGTDLTIRHCYFHHNQMGILAGSNTSSNVLIEYSEFAYHGEGAGGFSHNVYINHLNSLTFRYNYSHHSITGHTLKSRAHNNYIYYNRIGDEADGASSYNIDLPNGGRSFVIGNIVQQAQTSPNSTIITYGAEGLSNPVNELYLVHNTIVNNKASGTFLYVQSGASQVQLINNLFAGNGTVLNGTANINQGNVSTTSPGFENSSVYNYHLSSASPAINAGIVPGEIDGISLQPVFEYTHQQHQILRINNGLPDAGAYEYQGDNSGYLCSLPQYSLQFFGNGSDDIDRVKFQINPQTVIDVGDDMTIDFWLKCLSSNNTGFVYDQMNGDGWITGNIVIDRDIYGSGDYGDFGIAIGQSTGGSANERVVAFGVDRLGNGRTITGTTNIANNLWHHIAVTRNASSGLMKIFVDGVQDAQGTGPTGNISYRDNRSTGFPLSDPFLVVGAEKHDAGVEYPSFNGYFDELRISNLIRYSTGFAPITQPFISDVNTVLLCHFDEGSGELANDIAQSYNTSGIPTDGFLNLGGSPSGPIWSIDNPFYTAFTPVITASETEICMGNPITFSVPSIEGSTYFWTITGNYTILEGGTLTDSFITVQWNENGIGTVNIIQTLP
ncbi:MAG: right-handed parallel beta-helix repeat-containing protein [Sphingobacteriales bacterium]|nr:MAG: right-handed parallel beta-helix repeat-containing protein [Sphingobacteriales bacterium]